MTNKIKSIVLLIVSTTAVICSGVFLTNTSERLNTSKSNIEVLSQRLEVQKEKEEISNQPYTEVNTNPKTYKGNDLAKLNDEEKRLNYKKYVYSTSEDKFREMINKYISIRYNYDTVSEKKKITNRISYLITKEFKERLNKRLQDKWTSENAGVASGDNQHADIVSIAFGDSTQTDSADDIESKKSYITSYGKTALVKLKINNIFFGYTYIQFVSSENDYEWKISDEEIMALNFEED